MALDSEKSLLISEMSVQWDDMSFQWFLQNILYSPDISRMVGRRNEEAFSVYVLTDFSCLVSRKIPGRDLGHREFSIRPLKAKLGNLKQQSWNPCSRRGKGSFCNTSFGYQDKGSQIPHQTDSSFNVWCVPTLRRNVVRGWSEEQIKENLLSRKLSKAAMFRQMQLSTCLLSL